MAAYGLTAELADRLLARTDLDLVDMGGVGGTLAGNPLSVAAVCATLGEVLVDDVFDHMITRAARFAAGVQDVSWTTTCTPTWPTGVCCSRRFTTWPLMSPVTTDDAVDKHTQTFDMGIGELLGTDAG